MSQYSGKSEHRTSESRLIVESEKPVILIDVPNIVRDGYVLVYLKLLLEKSGYRVKLISGEKFTIFTLLKHMPQAVILPQVVEIKGASIAKYTKILGGKVILLPVEGQFYPKNDEEAKMWWKRRYTHNFDEVLDLVLSFTDRYKNAMTKYAQVDAEKIKVVGSPKFDFYKEPLINIFMTKKEFCKKHNLDINKKIVTLATNWPTADIDLQYAKNHIGNVMDYEWLERRHIMEKFVRKKVMENFVRLSKDLSNINFIVKIHPWEDLDKYLKYIDNIENITLIKNEHIGHVIKNSDVWLHVDCTTAKEAAIFGKPVISIKFWNDEYEYDDEKFAYLCDMAFTYDELKEKILYYLEGNPPKITADMIDHIEERFGEVDGKAIKRCADEISIFMENSKNKLRKIKLNFKVIKNIVKYDIYIIIRNLVYSNKFLRDTYLKLRWKKDEDYLNFINREIYSKNFDLQVDEIENKIKKLNFF